MENFVCANCRFRFSASKADNTCPYCGKRTLEKERSASELVDEVSSLLNE